jgi:hypothetical protein
MRFEHRSDCGAVPSEDELLYRPCRANAPRAKHGNALSPFASDAIVRDSVGVFPPQLDPEPLRRRIVARRIDLGKIAAPTAQIEEVRAFYRCLENFEIQILRRRAGCLEKCDAVVLHFRDRCRLVPCGVINAKRIRGERRRTEARSVGRWVDERGHHVTRSWSVHAVFGGNRERRLDPCVDQRIDASAEREKRVKIFSVGDFLEEVDRRKDRCDELYRLLPGQPLR